MTKLKNAKQILSVRPWTEKLLVGGLRLAAKITSAVNSWASSTSAWHPCQRWQVNCCVQPRRANSSPSETLG